MNTAPILNNSNKCRNPMTQNNNQLKFLKTNLKVHIDKWAILHHSTKNNTNLISLATQRMWHNHNTNSLHPNMILTTKCRRELWEKWTKLKNRNWLLQWEKVNETNHPSWIMGMSTKSQIHLWLQLQYPKNSNMVGKRQNKMYPKLTWALEINQKVLNQTLGKSKIKKLKKLSPMVLYTRDSGKTISRMELES